MLKRPISISGSIDNVKKQCSAICAENENPQLPAAAASPRKVAFIFRTIANGSFEIKLYLVSVDSSKEYGHIDPALQFWFPRADGDLPAICFLNSTLYMFDGFLPYTGHLNFPEEKTRAYKYVLSSEQLELGERTKQLEWGLPTSICHMNHMKHVNGVPAATPTPDGKKVLVFSTRFTFKDSGKAFELFNPDNESWETLPALPCTNCCKLDSYTGPRGFGAWCFCTSLRFVEVSAYSFIGKSVFYLELGFEAFSIDLMMNKAEWTSLGTPIVPPLRHGVRYFETVMGRYVIIPGDDPVYEDDGSLLCDDEGPTLNVYDVGDNGLLCTRDAGGYSEYGIEYRDPQVVLRLSPFGPSHNWLHPIYPFTIFPLLPVKEESEACCHTCFVVQQLEGVEPDENFPEGTDDDHVGETRFLIEVCRTDSHHKHTVSKAVSFSTHFSFLPGPVFFLPFESTCYLYIYLHLYHLLTMDGRVFAMRLFLLCFFMDCSFDVA